MSIKLNVLKKTTLIFTSLAIAQQKTPRSTPQVAATVLSTIPTTRCHSSASRAGTRRPCRIASSTVRRPGSNRERWSRGQSSTDANGRRPRRPASCRRPAFEGFRFVPLSDDGVKYVDSV